MDNQRLRPFQESDFSAFHELLSDYDVVKMTANCPWPPELSISRARMNTPEARAGLSAVIEVGGVFAGNVVLIKGVVGYTIARPFWGRGLASWAVGQKLEAEFAAGLDAASACVWQDNPASERVLLKNRFRKTGVCEALCKPRGVVLKNNTYRLTRVEWEAHNA